MTYFLLMLLILSPFGIYLLEKTNSKFKMVNMLFSPIVIIQFILSPLTTSTFANFNVYRIFTFIIILLFVMLLVFSIFKYRKKINFDKKLFYKSLSYSLILLISIIFIIFTSYVSRDTDNDLNYYINISKNFQNNYYCTNGLILSNGELISKTEPQYLFPQMYYFYSVISLDSITLTYKLLNPIFYISLCVYSIDELLSRTKIKNIITLSIIQFSVALLCISSLYLNVTAGNLAIQSLVIILLINNLSRNRNIDITMFFPFIGLSFFSSTGLLNSLIPIIVITIFYLIREKNKLNYFYLILIFVPLINYICVFGYKYLSNILITLLLYFSFFLFIIPEILKYIFREKYNNEIMYRNIKLNNVLFFSTFIVLSLVMLLTFLSNLIFIPNFAPSINHFNGKLSYLFLFFSIMLIFIFTWNFFKKQETNFTILAIFLTSFLSTFERLISSILIENHSAWRLVYLNLGMGNTTEIIIELFIILYLFIKCFVNFDSIKNQKIKKYINIGTLFVMSMAGSWCMISTYTPLFNNENQVFKSNATVNLKVCTDNDINLIKSINFDNYNKTYITDIMIGQYINKGTDITALMNYQEGKALTQSYHWNYLNFIRGIVYWNTQHKEHLPLNAESVIDAFDNLLNSFNKINFTNVNGNEINQLDYIIISKNTIYFQELKTKILNSGFNEYKNGDNIEIFCL